MVEAQKGRKGEQAVSTSPSLCAEPEDEGGREEGREEGREGAPARRRRESASVSPAQAA